MRKKAENTLQTNLATDTELRVSNVAVSDNTDSAQTNADNERVMVFEAGNVSFQILNEAASGINTQNIRIFDDTLENLLSCSKAVKRQKYCGSIDVAERAKSYCFKPFEFQLANVNAMLNRFEGRGVFGDQVGLGKTVEALMTAHAMFEIGIIRNAVLIVKESTKDDWRKEIENKFPDIFTIHEYKPTASVYDALSDVATNKEKPNCVPKDIYLLTDTMFCDNRNPETNTVQDLYDYKLLYKNAKRFYSETSETGYDKIINSINAINANSRYGSIMDILVKHGYKPICTDDIRNGDAEVLYKKIYNKTPPRIGGILGGTIPLKVIEDLIKCLKEKSKQLSDGLSNVLYSENIAKIKKEIDCCISDFERCKGNGIAKFEKINSYNLDKVWNETDPAIDLLIIDEIHSFYDSDLDNQVGYTDIYGRRKTTINFIISLKKRYCVALSATPIRTSLEDVLDLLRAVDDKRFGEDDKKAKDYFYSTICRLEPGTKHPLSDIVDDPTKRHSFFGIINNFFTRKRINDVSSAMSGSYEGKLPPKADIMNLVDKGGDSEFENCLKLKFEMIFMQMGMWTKEQAGEFWNNTNTAWSQQESIKDDNCTFCLKAAIDAVIMEDLKNKKYITDKEKQVLAYNAVNWTRRGRGA